MQPCERLHTLASRHCALFAIMGGAVEDATPLAQATQSCASAVSWQRKKLSSDEIASLGPWWDYHYAAIRRPVAHWPQRRRPAPLHGCISAAERQCTHSRRCLASLTPRLAACSTRAFSPERDANSPGSSVANRQRNELPCSWMWSSPG